MTNHFNTDAYLPAPPTSVACRHEYDSPHATVVIAGIPHSGTSMVAAVVDSLGFNVSQDFYNFEPASRPSCADVTLDAWGTKVTAANAEHEHWGLKDTMLSRFPAKDVHQRLRNPYYIVVSRDVAAVMQRGLPVGSPEQVAAVMEDAQFQTVSLWVWLSDLPPAPLLLISYERALRNRQAMCEGVAQFLDTSFSDQDIQRAVDRISLVGGYLTKEVL